MSVVILEPGFTLIEVLIVISMVSLLSIPAFGVYGMSQRRARDAVRRADLRAIQIAAEQYYQAYTMYPTSIENFKSGSPNGVLEFMLEAGSNFLDDPRSKQDYSVATANDEAYRVCADLEVASTGAVNTAWTGARTSGNDIFCVQNIQ